MLLWAARNVRNALQCSQPASLRSVRSTNHADSRSCRVSVRAVMITSVQPDAWYGKCTSSSVAGGIVLVKTRNVLVLATYTDPVNASQAVPYVHAFAEKLESLTLVV